MIFNILAIICGLFTVLIVGAAIGGALYDGPLKKAPAKARARDTFMALIISAVISFVLLVGLVGIVGFIISGVVAPTHHEAQTTEIEALGNGLGAHGRFFLGSGSVGSDQFYSYITKDENGGFHLESIRANNVVVYQDAPEGTGTYIQHEYWNELWWWAPFPIDSYYDSMDEFHIPPDSILFGYEVSVN